MAWLPRRRLQGLRLGLVLLAGRPLAGSVSRRLPFLRGRCLSVQLLDPGRTGRDLGPGLRYACRYISGLVFRLRPELGGSRWPGLGFRPPYRGFGRLVLALAV